MRHVAMFLVLAFLVAASLPAVDRTLRKPTIAEGSGDPPPIIICTTVYYKTCSVNGCLDSTAANACCGDCRHDDGSFAPCQPCTAN